MPEAPCANCGWRRAATVEGDFRDGGPALPLCDGCGREAVDRGGRILRELP